MPHTPQEPTASGPVCEVCGCPGLAGRQTMHPRCKAFRNYLDAALRNVPRRCTVRRGTLLRNALFAIANRLPVDRYDERGPDGRYTRRKA